MVTKQEAPNYLSSNLLWLKLDGFGHLFQPSLVQRTELHLSASLAWRLNAVTAYSFMDPLIGCLDLACPRVRSDLTSRVTQLLLGAMSDINFLDFCPCTVAVAGIRCGLDELLPMQSNGLMCNLLKLIPQGRKDELGTCFALMEEHVVNPTAYRHSYSPSSPVSVLENDKIKIADCLVDLPFFKNSEIFFGLPSNPKKRMREPENSEANSPAGK
ncbi:putative cyclin-D7-1 [Nymphaea thermarum]|nr:putative cyclin-D7-1 [Nymphaea thermarum]